MEPVIERLELAADDALLNTVSLLQRQLRDLVVTAANEAPRPAPVTRMRAREILRARAMRARFFNPKLFADPAWDMLLDMCRAHHEGHQVSVTSLCLASGVPSTTALRWVRLLEDEGLIDRTIVSEVPPWVEYSLTSKGADLRRAIHGIDRWADRWASQQ